MAREPTARPLRVGLIGAGLIGRLRARAIAQVPQLSLAAVADVRPESANTAARGHGNVTRYAEGRDLAADPGVEAVILATPPVSHETLGLACLAAGKHLLVEKPLATKPEACEALIRAADRAGVTLATGFNLRWTRAARLARQLVNGGAIGTLDHVRAYHGHPGGGEFTHDWIRNPAVSGGGTLMDNGIHLIDLAAWFLGDVRAAVGCGSNHVWRQPGCEDNGFLLFTNARGQIATLQASWTEWQGYGYRVEVYGSEGFVRFGYPPLYLIHGRRGPKGKVRVRRYLFPGYQVLERILGWEWGLVETLVHDLKGWAAAIQAGVQPPITGGDGLTAVRLAHAARHGLSVPLEEAA